MAYGAVQPPWWSEVWIVARGPSARTFDFDRLAGKTVISVNGAYRRHISILQARRLASVTQFSGDPNWLRDHAREFEAPPGEKYVAIPLDTNPDLADIRGVTYLRREHFQGLSDDQRSVALGGNSGYGAINLAYLKRATEIHLVGFDMDPADGEKFQQWAPRFKTMRAQLEHHGVRVVNHNPLSHIDAFEKAV
jgi:hypothetical protein